MMDQDGSAFAGSASGYYPLSITYSKRKSNLLFHMDLHVFLFHM